jgi:hypothetical protein
VSTLTPGVMGPGSPARWTAPEGRRVCDRLGIEFAGCNLIPDVTVLRPESSGAIWSDPADVALVVEVETPASARYDRMLKPSPVRVTPSIWV